MSPAGIVIYPDCTAIICNWDGEAGLPRIFGDGIVFMPENITPAGKENIPSWRSALDGYSVLYDLNGDMDAAEDCSATMLTLTDGTKIIAPDRWC